MPTLVYGEDGALSLALDGSRDRLTVGRDPAADVALPWDPEVSRTHARIERRDGGWCVVDPGSRNGSWINGERFTGERSLRDGDVLRFGTSDVRFRAPAPALAQTAVAGTVPAAVAAPAPPPVPVPAAAPPPPPPPTEEAPAVTDRPPRRRGRRIALALAGLLLVVLVAAQLLLPGLAEQRVRDELARDGEVTEVSISAFPAIKLLAGRADSVRVRMRSYRPGASGGGSSGSTGGVGDALAKTAAIGRIDVAIATLRVAAVTLRDVRFDKRGSRLTARAAIEEGALRGALPEGFDLKPVPDPAALVLNASVNALGLEADASARLVAEAGRLLIRPEGIPLGELASLTVFADERVEVTGVRASARDGGGYALTATAALR